jgi:hypothetical protein
MKTIEHKRKNQFGVRLKRYGGTWFEATLKYFMVGILANRREYAYSRAHPASTGIVPTYSRCFGIFVIQPTGQVLSDDHPAWRSFLLTLERQGVTNQDLLKARNFCLWNDGLYMLDYGSQASIEALDSGMLDVFEQLNAGVSPSQLILTRKVV